MDKPSIVTVLDHYGAHYVPDTGRWTAMKCPFHDDRSASASVNSDLNLFRCFACDAESPLGAKGSSVMDSFDVIAWQEGLTDFPSTKRHAENVYGGDYGTVPEESQGQSRRRVFGESRPKRGQRDAFSSRLRRRTRRRA